MVEKEKLAAALAATIMPFWLGGEAGAQNAVTDPVGYIINAVIGTGGTTDKVENLVTVPLVTSPEFEGTIGAISSNEIHLDDATLETEQFNTQPGSHYLEMRSGAGRGLVLGITDTAESSLTVARVPDGVLAAGDKFLVRPNHTLAGLFGENNEAGLLSGSEATSADNIVVLDPETNTQRVFYFHDDGSGGQDRVTEWREVAAAGDAGGSLIPFPSGLMIVRRGAGDLSFVNVGHVPFYPPAGELVAFLPVWPGQNLLSLPFNASTLDSSNLYTKGSPFSVIAGGDATEADVLIVNDNRTGSSSPPAYYREGEGWRQVGVAGDAGSWSFPFYSATRFQRAGAAGWIRFKTSLREGPGGLAAHATDNTLAGTEIAPLGRNEVAVRWPTEDGARYKILRRSLDVGARWQELPETHIGDGATASVIQPVGASTGAYFKVTQIRGQ